MKFSDELIRKLTIIFGFSAGVVFIISLVALIEFQGIFKYLAIAMIVFGILFFVFRSAYNYRETFKVKERKK